MTHEVIFPFRDVQDKGKSFPNGRVYAIGDKYPATKRKVSEERIAELSSTSNKIGRQLISEGEPTTAEVLDGAYGDESEVAVGNADYPWSLGGGYYELSDGSKVRGKAKAEEAEQKLGE